MDNVNFPVIGQQQDLDLFPVKEIEVDGIQMGVLNNGTPYLTMRGLSRLCGVDSATMVRFTTNWQEERSKPRGKKIDAILQSKGLFLDKLYTTVVSQGTETHAYPDTVCMAILEYYAFEAAKNGLFDSTTALQNYRALAESTLRRFIFLSVGIDPENPLRGALECFHERLLMNDQIPLGFFSVFREMADLSLRMVRQNFNFGPGAIPDISVGMLWSKHWVASNLDDKYGIRIKHPHVYPDWFPQAKSGPVEAWIYPDDALGEFRRWMQNEYIQNRLTPYLLKKVSDGSLPKIDAPKIIEALRKPELPKPH
ncbi:hypothetical protein FMK56_12630 [Klebsiella oxytoca]|uniref:hypothetical protein n=1 Tax=Klebsiella oxytoca TaxID=571 RepID=UPI001CC902DA|nr:hypothetical protein [Klebsiella oxytoca]EKZ9478276.1 hypothetical protein [Klebsiella oxytoca]ELJ5741433.1 hypothetical protein [Klebsiella oxytoca]MBZ7165210.1 hypothetical protein [Klebsiella oxytoca]